MTTKALVGDKVYCRSAASGGGVVHKGKVASFSIDASYMIQLESGGYIQWPAGRVDLIPQGKKCLVKACPNGPILGEATLCGPCAAALEGGGNSEVARDRIRASLHQSPPKKEEEWKVGTEYVVTKGYRQGEVGVLLDPLASSILLKFPIKCGDWRSGNNWIAKQSVAKV